MEFIKAKSNLIITLALLLAFAAAFFSLAAARRPHPSAAVDFSVLKLPTKANNTANVVKECPSWCEECVEVEDLGKICGMFIVRYCDKKCTP
uniref:Trypsin inhibitor1 n=1 Tax=Oncidium hybrid cultivar TaxID=141207 RepID=F5BCP5_ONCHC|nr:trypsin inhibitor1 [Oncidium hybrid cultivar]